jgi:hypothetical protein
MVVYSGAPIKMGEGIEEGTDWGALPSQPERDEERTIKLFGGVGVE